MAILRIEHPVPSFDGWKAAFDGDPVGRERGGVLGYRITRPVDDPNYVAVDLDFATTGEAEVFLDQLRELWSRVDVMRDPVARVFDEVEERRL